MSLENQRLVRLATYTSVAIATLLAGTKSFAWYITDAVSLLASLLDSVLDALASLLVLFAVRQSQQPATRTFRFGYGKAEALAAMGQSGLIFISVLWLLYEAIDRLIHPAPLGTIEIGVFAVLITMILTAGLVAFQNYVVRSTGSVAIRADSMHYRTDFLINAGVLISLIVTHVTSMHWFDSAVAIALAIYIIFPLRKIAAEAIGILMDRELNESFRIDIEKLANSHPAVHGIHDLRTRESGERKFVQLHLELDGILSLSAAHKVAEEVEKMILKTYPDCEIIIHQDPVGIIEKRDEFIS